VPACVPGRAFERLNLVVSTQSTDRAIVERDDTSPAPRLRRANHGASSNLGDLLDDEQAAAIEVDVLPPKANDLATPHAGGHQ
jgi:hypothetical protein